MNQVNRWALVTGASSGIGQKFSEVLAEKGWNLILVARREHLLSELKTSLETKFQVQVIVHKADLLKNEDLDSVVNIAREYRVSFFINNAGILSRGNFHEKNLSESQGVIGLNVMALTYLSHGVINCFKNLNTDCYLLNVGSVNSYISTAGQAVYSGSKAYVKSFSLALAEELSNTKIKVSCLCPGGTESEIMDVAGATVTEFGQKFLMSAESVALQGVAGIERSSGVVVPGWSNKFITFACRFLPEQMMTRITSLALGKAVSLK